MNRIFTFILSFLFLIFLLSQLSAQVALTPGNSISIDFNTFTGNGFSPSPAAGQLDSDDWRVSGFSDGDGVFGGTHDAGDFARGSDAGGVSSGGLYAFETSAGDFSLGVQATGSDWNPGMFDLRIINNTGAVLSELNVHYDIFVLNNADRSSAFNFSYSEDDLSYSTVAGLDFSSPETADASPAWISTGRVTSLTGLNVADGGYLYLRWQGSDLSGSGSRDEFALDNILIDQGDSPLPVELNSFKAYGENAKVSLKWTTAAELNNRGFIIMRSASEKMPYIEISSYKYNENLLGAGTSSSQHNYTYLDQTVLNGYTYWYKLIDVDFNGIQKVHGPVSVTPQINIPGGKENTFPDGFALYQNYPNPFNPGTSISYDIPQTAEGKTAIEISVYNILGKKVAQLFKGSVDAGSYSISWNGTDLNGHKAPAGIYIYQMNSQLFRKSLKMMLLK
jgi:FlgD Ig-like domain